MFTFKEIIRAIDMLLGEDIPLLKTPNKDVFHTHGNIFSLVDTFTVTPSIIISKTLKGSPILKDVIEYQMQMFSTVYVRAFEVLTKIHGLEVGVAFDLLSDSKRLVSGYVSESATFEDLLVDDDEIIFLALEEKNTKKAKLQQLFTVYAKVSLHGKDKVIVEVPIKIMATIEYVDPSEIVNLVSSENNRSIFDVIDGIRSGASSVSDLVFATSMIKDYRKRKMKDRIGLLKRLRDRNIVSISKYAKHKLAGYSKLYQMFILSSDDTDKLNKRLKGNVFNDKGKNDFLNQTSSLSLTIVDQDEERVVIMHRDTVGSVDFSFKEITGNQKDDAINELLKVLMTTRSI